METMHTRELISALADGQLQGDDFARGVQATAADPQALAAWQDYHLIGDVLRSSELAASSPSAAFLARLQVRLDAEAPLQPERPIPADEQPPAFDLRRAPANEASMRWKMVAGVASLAAVAAIGWNVAGPGNAPGQGQFAGLAPQASEGVIAVSREGASGPMIRDARLDQLLAAHRQFGGAIALQAPAGALRNATFEAPAR
ncbi:sigma-E factor negative regulatory protein [Ramlibacter sp.]|uniref:sigma-E factor negative regulatory protein n=1 Tax=Ramlibacter sp. TaxID=1917967 RepID=UPI001805C4BD|nr:sigma-E factor negative regulatory protein [Ramlibacter sp.]MBA2674241.1 sigma-E factor negative regulatory protein [Ramlibacter sp.]